MNCPFKKIFHPKLKIISSFSSSFLSHNGSKEDKGSLGRLKVTAWFIKQVNTVKPQKNINEIVHLNTRRRMNIINFRYMAYYPDPPEWVWHCSATICMWSGERVLRQRQSHLIHLSLMCLSACENRGCDTAEYNRSVLIYLQALLTHSLRYTAQDEISLPETFIKKC